jgi:hypothetical protein
MKKLQVEATKRLLVSLLVTAIVVGVSALAIQAPTQNQNSLTLKSIQTDKATLLYADNRGNGAWFVEMVLPGTSESKAATENLKAVAATL